MNSDLQLKHRYLLQQGFRVLAKRSIWRQGLAVAVFALALTIGQALTPARPTNHQTVRQNTNPEAAATETDQQGWVAVETSAVSATSSATTSTLFTADFGVSQDQDYDKWPDGWKRRVAPGFPHYVQAEIEEGPSGDRALAVSLNGGRFAALSPEIDINPRFSYQFSIRVLNQGQEDAAYLTVRWLDAQHQLISEVHTSLAMSLEEWKELSIAPPSVPPAAQFAQLALQTEPGRLPDLDGRVWFDDVLVTSTPQIELRIPHAVENAHLFRLDEFPTVQLQVNGQYSSAEDVSLQTTLTDERGRQLMEPRTYSLTADADQSGPQESSTQSEFQTEIEVPNLGVGYYRLTATLREGDRPVTIRQIAWLVVGDLANRLDLDFAWSAENGAQPLSEAQLVQLVGNSGIGWLKFPAWAEPDDDQHIARLARLVDELAAKDIRMVGLLNKPPQVVLQNLPEGTPENAAGIFSMPVDDWYPHLLPTQRRIAMSVRRWQLSTDDDLSFVGHRNLPLRIREVKSALDRLGHNVQLGMTWNWLHPLPAAPTSVSNPVSPPWSELSLSTRPSLSPEEIARYLSASTMNAPGAENVERWVNVETLSAQTHSLESRATHLAKQIAAAKAFGASGINLPRALSPAQGMIHADGSPAELFLVWRTLATRFSGAEFLGTLQLPGGSQNLVFSRAGQTLMMVWNDQPTRESLYLGEAVEQFDLWGRRLPVDDQDEMQEFEVGPLPTILTNLNEPVARFRMTVQLEKEIVPAVFGRTSSNSISFANPFPYPIAGRSQIPTPPGWKVSTGTGEFHLQEGEATQQPFYASFPYTAETGRHMLKLDFRLVADRDYRFSIYREIEVGMREIEWDLMARIDSSGVLHVEHRLRNVGNRPRRMRVILYAPNRQRRATPLLSIAPGINYHQMQVYDADDLRGEPVRFMLEEPGTNRFLNKNVTLGN